MPGSVGKGQEKDRKMKKPISSLLLLGLLFIGSASYAEVKSRVIEYQDGETTLKGHLYWDNAIKGKRPGVMVVHEWWGLNDYAKSRARMLAEIGYVAFAADMYGDNRVTTHGDQAGSWMKQITNNISHWQSRAQLGLSQLKQHSLVEPSQLAAIGYCFGGATVMQLAYSGAELRGVVSFHGSLPPASEDQYQNIKAKVLVAHGNSDPFVPAERVTAFQASLDAAGADWQFLSLGGAQHGFTNPGADAHKMKGLKYDADADRRSWQAMQQFFGEIFN